MVDYDLIIIGCSALFGLETALYTVIRLICSNIVVANFLIISICNPDITNK
jgi:hypothetical protein